MSEPHITYYIKVDDHGYGDEFFISGNGSAGWEFDWTKDLDWHSDCSGPSEMKVYKFDQSDPSNAGHPFYLSTGQGGTHFGALAMGAGEGVYYCGTPGFSGASTKVNMAEMRYSSAFQPNIYPFCPNYSSMVWSEFVTNEISGDPCVSGDYDCPSSCSLGSYLTGVLTGLIHRTNEALSGDYASFTTTSYTIKTGVETGAFNACRILATGATSGVAVSRRSDYTFEFYHSGKCYDDELGGYQKQYNINNASVSGLTNPATTISGSDSIWRSWIYGYFTKRYYVAYDPIVSGQKMLAVVDVNCPDTTFDVTLERDRQDWVTTGTAAREDDIVRKLNVTLNASCSGYRADLSARCEKVKGGVQQYCSQPVENGGSICWEDDFEEGNYRIKYVSGAYQTSGNKFMIGTGHLDVSEII